MYDAVEVHAPAGPVAGRRVRRRLGGFFLELVCLRFVQEAVGRGAVSVRGGGGDVLPRREARSGEIIILVVKRNGGGSASLLVVARSRAVQLRAGADVLWGGDEVLLRSMISFSRTASARPRAVAARTAPSSLHHRSGAGLAAGAACAVLGELALVAAGADASVGQPYPARHELEHVLSAAFEEVLSLLDCASSRFFSR